ncbi:hypothetical protein M3Y99_00573500 [Aphelenchoides fujianensis]|nr:hypothetical protein M3Y99_00573500 [Aphelenchoides fujianensis]
MPQDGHQQRGAPIDERDGGIAAVGRRLEADDHHDRVEHPVHVLQFAVPPKAPFVLPPTCGFQSAASGARK